MSYVTDNYRTYIHSHIHAFTQTDRQASMLAEWQRGSHRQAGTASSRQEDRLADRQTQTGRHRQADAESSRQVDRLADRQTQTGRQVDRLVDRQVDRLVDRQVDRLTVRQPQAGRQVDRLADSPICAWPAFLCSRCSRA